MNFKPTLWKTVIPLVLGVLAYTLSVITGLGLGGNEIPMILIFIVLVPYLIWSLLQKGKAVDNPAVPVADVAQ